MTETQGRVWGFLETQIQVFSSVFVFILKQGLQAIFQLTVIFLPHLLHTEILFVPRNCHWESECQDEAWDTAGTSEAAAMETQCPV